MTKLNRRSMIKTGVGAAALLTPLAPDLTPSAGARQQQPAAAITPAAGMTPVGKLVTRPSIAIKASRLSLGFETLDRRMFVPEKTYSFVSELGVKWARMQTGWARTETKKGEYDFAWLDAPTDALAKIGVQPWFSLSYGNRLYTPQSPHEYAIGWVPLNDDEARRGWVNYAGRIAERFRTRVRHWEIWNEPNIPNYWQPTTPNPAQYVELVRLAAPEIRRRVPNAVIVGGALASIPRVLDYLEGCLEAGLAQYVDRVSYHPYRQVPEANYEAEVKAFRALLAKYKPGLDIWQGENGCPSQNDGGYALSNLDWNEIRQAKWLLRRLLTDLKLGVELTSWLHIVDMYNYVGAKGMMPKNNYKGLLSGKDQHAPKPSYHAYQNLCALFDAETAPADFVTISYGREADDVYTASFVRAGRPIFARWLPVSLQSDKPAERSTVELWSGKTARLTEPVSVDLLNGQIHRLEKAQLTNGWWKIEDLPLTDYPLLITDRSIVSASLTKEG